MDSRDRPLVLHYAGTVDYAGTSRSCERLMRHLDKDRFDVHVLYNEIGENSRLQFVREFLPPENIHAFWMKDRSGPYYSPTSTNLPEVLRSIGDVDVFHFHRSGYTEYPLVPDLASHFRYVVETNIFAESDYVIEPDISLCVSEHIRQRKTIKKNTDVLYNGIDPPATNAHCRDELGLVETDIVLGRIGRDDENIFDPISLDAYQRIQAPNLYYLIVNPCGLTKQHVERGGIENIIFLDRIIGDAELSKFYNTIDILAHARKDGETFGCNIAEAMIHGKPVVSHFSSIFNAQKEIIGNGGFVAKDVNEYQQFLSLLIENDHKRKEVGETAKRRAIREFRIDVVTKKLEHFYETVLRQPYNECKLAGSKSEQVGEQSAIRQGFQRIKRWFGKTRQSAA